MSTFSAHADSEKPFCDKLNRFVFNDVEKKNGRDRAGGKADTKQTKIQKTTTSSGAEI